MIKISLRYPDSEDGRFDIDYYVNKHAPWARKLMGAALKGFEIEQGVSGREPDSNPTYVAIANLYFDSVDDFKSSYGPNAVEIQSDICNYTGIQPTMQISQVKDSHVPTMA
ncbi:EthD family reductase [Ruegeria hyattellae]|uniref:EthD family reductase n=1 Tax=Ruegeria hyattellae TaxID=3233337 RepID=UPI00355B8FD9